MMQTKETFNCASFAVKRLIAEQEEKKERQQYKLRFTFNFITRSNGNLCVRVCVRVMLQCPRALRPVC